MYPAKEAAKITGLSTAALRYYEKERLLPPVKRNDQRYRQYTDEDIEWIRMIQCMRMANIPIQSIKKYVSLLIQGGKTLEQRYEMVQEHIETIMGQIANLQKALTLTQSKAAFYEKILKEPLHQDLTYAEEWKMFDHGGHV
ncbi:MAG: MerR family transcriptional regulator [Lachnospiraceae bacterium]|nr:MerR family transcriptional regulator [Lachnospiraceae bacterium]